MGQKVNPHGFRVGVIKDWDSRWYASNEKVGDLLVEDHKIRVYLKKLLYAAGVSKIEIERSNEVVTVYLHVARPGVVIGKGGEQIEQYRKDVEKLIGKTVKLNIVEVRNPDMDAQLVAENIAAQLEKRISHRRAMKNAMGRAMRAGAKGIKCNCSGRLGGREIAGSEHYHEGTIPLQTLRADIDYGFAEAATTFGRIGVKVWIYKGEILSQALRTTPRTLDTSKPYQERRERRGRRDGDRRGRAFHRLCEIRAGLGSAQLRAGRLQRLEPAITVVLLVRDSGLVRTVDRGAGLEAAPPAESTHQRCDDDHDDQQRHPAVPFAQQCDGLGIDLGGFGVVGDVIGDAVNVLGGIAHIAGLIGDRRIPTLLRLHHHHLPLPESQSDIIDAILSATTQPR